MGSITLHPEHGLNPTIPRCFFCGAEKNEVALLGRACKEQAPRSMVLDMRPCEQCAEWMRRGCILISIRDGEPQSRDPYRTGRFAVMIDDAVQRIFDPNAAELILKCRFAFIEDSAWDKIGIPIVEKSVAPRKRKGAAG